MTPSRLLVAHLPLWDPQCHQEEELDNTQYHTFVKERLSSTEKALYETISKNKLKLLDSGEPKTDKSEEKQKAVNCMRD